MFLFELTQSDNNILTFRSHKPINANQFSAKSRAMKTLKVCFFAIITTLQLAPCLAETCGEATFVQVVDQKKLHFPWAGAVYSVVNKNEKFICGVTLLTKFYAVSGIQN
jgi:hypothetical protein